MVFRALACAVCNSEHSQRVQKTTPTFLGSLLEIPDFKHATSVIYAEKETTCNLNTNIVHKMIVITRDDGTREGLAHSPIRPVSTALSK